MPNGGTPSDDKTVRSAVTNGQTKGARGYVTFEKYMNGETFKALQTTFDFFNQLEANDLCSAGKTLNRRITGSIKTSLLERN